MVLEYSLVLLVLKMMFVFILVVVLFSLKLIFVYSLVLLGGLKMVFV